MSTTVKPPRVGDPIIFRAQKDGPEHTVRPCSGNHRALWLSNYIILSCSKCKITKADLVPAEITSDEELEAERRDRRRQEPDEREA